MERWSSLSNRQKVAVALGVSAGAALLYAWYTRPRTGEDYATQRPGPPQSALSASHHGEDTLYVTVPQRAVELIVGHDGAITEQLTIQSQAHIEVNAAPEGGGGCELTITGSPAQVHQTQHLLHRILRDEPMLRVELQLPARSIGRIIGQGGERIREIARSCGARIYCDRRTEDNKSTLTRRVTVTGTQQQVDAAKTLLQKASEEDAAVQRRAAETSTFRSRRKDIIAVKKMDIQHPQEDEEKQQPSGEALQAAGFSDVRPLEDDPPVQENMAACTSIRKFEVNSPDFNFSADEYVDVYVSAVENPEHFWIQILGCRSSQLDKLITQMSDHYQREKRGTVLEIQVGDIVAAPFYSDKFWYRAKVLGFLKNGSVDLYYVDYGDNWDTAKENLYPLRSDFLSLPFQAIECRLSGVAPRGGTWSDQALDTFDSLSHCAQWEPLLAKISSFPSPGVSCYFQIQLFDPSVDPMLDIGMELICQGYAVECSVSPMKADDACLVSRLLEEVTNLPMWSEAGTFSSQQEEEHLACDGSIERMRADVSSSLDHLQSAVSTPLSCTESVEETEGLEQSISNIHLSDSDHPSTGTSISSADSSALTKSSSTENSPEVSSSTCTDSEEQSCVSSSEDSSVHSPRGCFYYMDDEAFNSSMCTNSSGEIITISSDSEEDTRGIRVGIKKAPMDSDVLPSSSSDVIVIEDDP